MSAIDTRARLEVWTDTIERSITELEKWCSSAAGIYARPSELEAVFELVQKLRAFAAEVENVGQFARFVGLTDRITTLEETIGWAIALSARGALPT